jgi:hypothetical protein
MTRARTGIIAMALVVAIAAAACGGGDDDDSGASPDTGGRAGTVDTRAEPTPLDIVKRAVTTTRESGTARVAHRLVFDASALDANEASSGVADLQHDTAQWENDMSGSPRGLVPDGTPADQVHLKVRQVDGSLYVSLPAAYRAAGIAQDWLRVPVNPPPGSTGFTGFEKVSPRIALSARFERPEVAFKILDTVSGARLVGPASTRGKETTRYSIDVQLRAMLEEVGLMFFFGDPKDSAKLAAIDKAAAEASTVDVFIDELGRIRELLVVSDLSLIAPLFDPPQDPKIWRELRLQWDFYDYGVKVDVQAPTASVLPVN